MILSTGSGLRYTVLPSREMDICHAEYNGIPLSVVSRTGFINGSFYEGGVYYGVGAC